MSLNSDFYNSSIEMQYNSKSQISPDLSRQLKHIWKKIPINQIRQRLKTIKEEIPTFQLKNNFIQESSSYLYTRVYEGLCSIDSNQIEQILMMLEGEDHSNETMPFFELYHFDAIDICKEMFVILKNFIDSVAQMNNKDIRFYQGFCDFIQNNRISIPDSLLQVLFCHLFPNSTIKLNEESVSNRQEIQREYNLYCLPLYEEDLKAFLENLSLDEIHALFDLHFLWNLAEMAYQNQKKYIEFTEEHIPILKRIFIAQIFKLNNDGKYTNSDIDSFIQMINHIYEITTHYNYLIEPWENFI